MRKTVVCVFAHPDDETMGPAGTICKLSKDHDVYILCATRGQFGQDSIPRDKMDLKDRRTKEMNASAKILGVKKVFFLGFKDGELSNNKYHRLARKIEKYLKELRPEIVITVDQRGTSGHIDHIVVSLVTTFVVKKLKFVKELWYSCVSEEKSNLFGKDYFIYFPEGYKKEEIDMTIDVSDAWDARIRCIYEHESQKHDMVKLEHCLGLLPKEEYFIVKKLSH